jgi:hypothetical protein
MRLLRGRWWEALITLGIVVALIGGAVLFARVHAVSSVSHNSLCAFKANLEERIASTEDFLKDHPEGFAGIPAATLQQSADNQQSTVDALERGGLNCD